MKRLKLFIPFAIFGILAVIFLFSLDNDNEKLPSMLIDKPVPKFSLPSLHDPSKMINEQTLKGQPYLINVWATWCTSCKVEHPYLIKLAQMGVPILGVDYKDDGAAARALLQKSGDPYQEVVYDEEGRLVMSLGVYGAPETFVVDAEGIIRHKIIGVVDQKNWSAEISKYFFN